MPKMRYPSDTPSRESAPRDSIGRNTAAFSPHRANVGNWDSVCIPRSPGLGRKFTGSAEIGGTERNTRTGWRRELNSNRWALFDVRIIDFWPENRSFFLSLFCRRKSRESQFDAELVAADDGPSTFRAYDVKVGNAIDKHASE